MAYEVRVTPEFAKRFKLRRRAGFQFSRVPLVLDEVPDDVKNDPCLVVSKAKKGKAATAEVEAPRPDPSASLGMREEANEAPASDTAFDVHSATYAELVAKAGELEIPHFGVKKEALRGDVAAKLKALQDQ